MLDTRIADSEEMSSSLYEPSRRCFLRDGLAFTAALLASPVACAPSLARARPPGGGPGRGSRASGRRVRGGASLPPRIDCCTYDRPSFDVKRALDGGLTTAVIDLDIYPRTFQSAIVALRTWNAAFLAADSRLVRVLRGADIGRAIQQKKLGVVLSCQDASILGVPTRSTGDVNLQNLRLFYDLGLRVLSLTHNDRNGVGDAFGEKSDAGLSRLGEDVVRAMNDLGMVIDLSHCSRNTTRQSIRLSTKPCVVTHAGCRSVYNSARNKSDEDIRALADRGGLFAVFSMSLWLTDRPTSSVDDVVAHIDHAVNVAGTDHVGYSSDGPVLGVLDPDKELRSMQATARRKAGLPGYERVPAHTRISALNGPNRVEVLAAALARRGHKAGAIDRLLGGNMVRVIREVCG